MTSTFTRSLAPLAVALLQTALAIVVQGAPAGRPATSPNIVLFITDDESWLERSAYGWSNLPTPHFDRVAREGVLFTRGFTSAPSCAPARAALLTGKNFWELEEGAFIQAWLPAKFRTLPEILEAAGYHAGFTGKGWGPGVPPPGSSRGRNPAGKPFNTVKNASREEGISDIDYAGNFARFLAARPAGKPFWFWIGTNEPHDPVGADNHRRLVGRHGIGLDRVKVPGFLPDTPGVRRHRANMLYEVCHADDTLGRVLKILEERGELANTLLIVTADNGTAVPQAKTNLYDWGVRVPLAMMWPARIKPARRVDDFVNFIDLAPTVLAAAGVAIPSGMTGSSLLDVLLSPASGRIDPKRSWTAAGLEWHGEADPVNLAGRVIRDERYAYIINYGAAPRMNLSESKALPDAVHAQTAETAHVLELIAKHPQHPAVQPFVNRIAAPRPREELYDCESDPWQLHNLAGSTAHAAILQRLRSQLETYQRQTGDPRATGDMDTFNRTRAFVLKRKFGPGGYGER